MINIMNIDGYKAIINYDPVIDKFRGEFIGLNGGADFYATNIEELREEGKSLNKCVTDLLGEAIQRQ